MRTFLSVLAVFALACASAQADALVVNDIVDALLWRMSHNEHITSLPDLEEAAEVKMLFWNTSVRINADNGALVGSVALKRFGDATMVIDDVNDLSVHVEIGFDEAVLGYEYKTEVAGVKGPGGRFNATVGATSVEGRIVLELTTDFCHVMFLGLKIAKLGEIEVQHGGSNVVNAVYHKLLVDMLVKERLSVLQEGIDALVYSLGYDCNKILPSISLPIS